MARRAPSRKKTQPSIMSTVLFAIVLLMIGVVSGYAWRSYAPLALPFETKLVSDSTSADFDNGDLRRMAKLADERADRAERQRDEAMARIAKLEAERHATERELADLKIKSVLMNADD